jgi:hypothetical protein
MMALQVQERGWVRRFSTARRWARRAVNHNSNHWVAAGVRKVALAESTAMGMAILALAANPPVIDRVSLMARRLLTAIPVKATKLLVTNRASLTARPVPVRTAIPAPAVKTSIANQTYLMVLPALTGISAPAANPTIQRRRPIRHGQAVAGNAEEAAVDANFVGLSLGFLRAFFAFASGGPQQSVRHPPPREAVTCEGVS